MARVVARARRQVGSPGFLAALAVLLLLFAGLRFGASDRGQAFLVRYGLTRHFALQLATRLDVALARRFLAMGLVRGDLKARQVTEGGQRVREYAFASPAHLTPTQCHLELERAACAVHGEVLRAEERHTRGEELVLLLGFGRVATHRIVIRPAQLPRDIAARRPRIVLVVDDVGHNLNRTTRGFLDLDVPVTLAILPDLGKSDEAFDLARERGVAALLHLPMEPEGKGNPGKRPVAVGMDSEAIDALVGAHLEHYEGFLGVNNHMGSRATAHRPTMTALMQALRRRDLLFVDSQTTARSVGREAARAAGVRFLANDLFLDDREEDADGVAANLERLGAMARQRGLAVGIAHPHPETLAGLRGAIPRLRADGIEFVSLESLWPGGSVAVRTAGRGAPGRGR